MLRVNQWLFYFGDVRKRSESVARATDCLQAQSNFAALDLTVTTR